MFGGYMTIYLLPIMMCFDLKSNYGENKYYRNMVNTFIIFLSTLLYSISYFHFIKSNTENNEFNRFVDVGRTGLVMLINVLSLLFVFTFILSKNQDNGYESWLQGLIKKVLLLFILLSSTMIYFALTVNGGGDIILIQNNIMFPFIIYYGLLILIMYDTACL